MKRACLQNENETAADILQKLLQSFLEKKEKNFVKKNLKNKYFYEKNFKMNLLVFSTSTHIIEFIIKEPVISAHIYHYLH